MAAHKNARRWVKAAQCDSQPCIWARQLSSLRVSECACRACACMHFCMHEFCVCVCILVRTRVRAHVRVRLVLARSCACMHFCMHELIDGDFESKFLIYFFLQ